MPRLYVSLLALLSLLPLQSVLAQGAKQKNSDGPSVAPFKLEPGKPILKKGERLVFPKDTVVHDAAGVEFLGAAGLVSPKFLKLIPEGGDPFGDPSDEPDPGPLKPMPKGPEDKALPTYEIHPVGNDCLRVKAGPKWAENADIVVTERRRFQFLWKDYRVGPSAGITWVEQPYEIRDAAGKVVFRSTSPLKLRHVFTGQIGTGTWSLAISQDGKTFASAQQKDVKVWDLTAGKELHSFHFDIQPAFVALSPDGKTLAVVDYENNLRIWDVPARKEKDVFRGVRRSPCVFTPDGKSLVCRCGILGKDDSGAPQKAMPGGNGGPRLVEIGAELRVLDLAKKTERVIYKPIAKAGDRSIFGTSLAVSPDGKTVAVGGMKFIRIEQPGRITETFVADKIQLIDFDTGKERAVLRNAPEGGTLTFSPDGAALATTDQLGVRFWDVASGKQLANPQYGLTGPIAISVDGKTMVSLGGGGGRFPRHSGPIYVWEVTVAPLKSPAP